ncbi:BrnA antitoxin family protein [Fulvimarina sp. MAC8]|uniref:BrnA antitoxin family protein n=1 Tax=Fulvimarina sp. MAC8 TaxID=3162874 RepID=UPI0032EB9B7C
MSRPSLIDSENPEWTEDDFANARPASELPERIRAAFPRTRGPQKAATKVPVSIRLSPDVLDHFKAGGPGWQSRIDETLRKAAGLER